MVRLDGEEMMKSISRIRDYSVVALNRELATKHITEIVAITNQIQLVEYTPEQILDESQGPGMWEYRLLVLDGDQPIADLMAYEKNDSIYISILAVHRDYQRQGIGKELLRIFLERNKGRYFTVQTNLAAWNKHVQDLYRSIGFEEIGKKEYDNRTDFIFGLTNI